jgi:hypothetical protein
MHFIQFLLICFISRLSFTIEEAEAANSRERNSTITHRIVLASLGVLGHAVPLTRIGAELVEMCCASSSSIKCVVDFASHTSAKVWWEEETVAVKESKCLGSFFDLGPLPRDWGEKLDKVSTDPSLFRGTLSVFSDLYLEALPDMYVAVEHALTGASLAVIDVGSVGAVEQARALNVSVVIHSPTVWADTFSQFEPPHWLPAFGSGLSKEMTLTERCLNALLPRLLSVALQPALMRLNKMRFDRGLEPHQSSHQVYQDVRSISSMALGFEHPRLVSQLHAYVGPILPKRTIHYRGFDVQIQQYLKQYRGIIIVRFGSMVSLDPESIQAFTKALETYSDKSNFAVLWFHPSIPTNLKSLARNIRYLDTRGKMDVDQYMAALSHSKSKLSISTCGSAATQEPLYFAIPVLCIPLVADHADIAARLRDSKAGIVMDKEDISIEAVEKAIVKIVTDRSFRGHAQLMKSAFRLAGGRKRAALHIMSSFYPNDHLLLNQSLAWHKRVGVDVFAVFFAMFLAASLQVSLWSRFRHKLLQGF